MVLKLYIDNAIYYYFSSGTQFLNFSSIFFMGVNFENSTVEFYVPYVLNMISNFVQIKCYLLFDQ